MRQKTTHYSRTREKPRLQCRQAKPRRVRRRICLLRSVSRPSFGCRKSGRFAPPTRGSSSEEKIANWGQKRLTCGQCRLERRMVANYNAPRVEAPQRGAIGDGGVEEGGRHLSFERCRSGPLPPPLDLGFGFGFGQLHPVTVAGKLEDDGVMHEAVDSGHRGHRIFEDLVPLAEDQV